MDEKVGEAIQEEMFGIDVPLLGRYENGNYTVSIFEDGTKIRVSGDDEFVPAFPESIDLKITNRCDMGCPMCHENSVPDGALSRILTEPFLDTLHPFTELAIGGGNPLTYPSLVPFLKKLRERDIIPNMTVNEEHFVQHTGFLKALCDDRLIFGLGVSFSGRHPELFDKLAAFPNAVIHIINGIATPTDLVQLARQEACRKLLILGYKDFRRGENFRHTNGDDIARNQKAIQVFLRTSGRIFDVVAFDNLAVAQLKLSEIIPEEVWEERYLGEDGAFTMYIDAVERKFAVSSTSRQRFDLLDNIEDMFRVVREERG